MRYKLSEGVTIEHVDGNNILVSDDGAAAILNDTATSILRPITDGEDCGETAQKLANAYEMEVAIVVSDVEEFLHDLMEKNLIQLQLK